MERLKKLKLLLLLLSLSLSTTYLDAQDKDTFLFKGVIKNEATNEVIPYATVSIKGTSVGVAANDKGQFEFPIRPEYFDQAVEIRALGYKNYHEQVRALQENEKRDVLMEEAVMVLSEVLVIDLSPEDIVKKALNSYDKNFPSSPYEMDVFYRSTLKENQTYVKLLECIFEAYDKGYDYLKIPKAVEIEYKAVRKSDVYTNDKTKLPAPFFKPQWLLTNENYSRYRDQLLQNANQSLYDFKMDTASYLSEELVYIVDADVKDEVEQFIFSIRYYIRAKDYAIVQMDFDGKDKVKYVQPSGIPNSLTLNIQEYKATYVFKEYEGKMYMHYLNNYAIYDWCDSKTGKIINNNEENSQALVQNITFPPKGKSTLDNPAKRNSRTLPPIQYQSEYWASNNLVNQIPYDPEITEDLESKGKPLEEQFTQNAQ